MFRAGAAIVDITPDLGCHLMGYFNDRIADDIHDRLHAKAIVLSDGSTSLGFVVCDLIVIPNSVAEQAKTCIEKTVGIPASHVLICGTHTHTGPAIEAALGTPEEEGYGEWVATRIADAFVLAYRRLEPAQVGYTRGDCGAEVHNRRYHMKDGSVRTNPGYLNPDIVEPAGPTDPGLGLLILRTPERRPIAVLANLALHYVGAGVATAISADYFAVFGETLQRCAGTSFVAPITNGCSGDINNIDTTRPAPTSPHPYFQIERVANVAASEAWKIWNGLREEDFRSDVKLDARLERIPFHARVPSDEELEAAQARLAAGTDPKDREWAYAREIVLVSEAPSVWDVPIQAIRIGDLGIVGLPAEVFAEIGLDIKARSPFVQTINISLANAWVGYVATDKALDEGSYETRLCRHVRSPKGTGKLWADTSVKLLMDMRSC